MTNNPSSDIWECRQCNGVNAWNWQDAEKAERRLTKRRGVPAEVAVAHGSCFDNVCGHCGTNFVRRDSPIRAELYVH